MKTLQQYKRAKALYIAEKYGVEIVYTGGTGSALNDFLCVVRLGKRLELVKIQWDPDGETAYIIAFCYKIHLREFKANF